ncbi:hypothetical protein JW905_08200 [bacterium]|nr:hypothetical protein [candidate division CSSED10-310 bacterium]
MTEVVLMTPPFFDGTAYGRLPVSAAEAPALCIAYLCATLREAGITAPTGSGLEGLTLWRGVMASSFWHGPAPAPWYTGEHDAGGLKRRYRTLMELVPV